MYCIACKLLAQSGQHFIKVTGLTSEKVSGHRASANVKVCLRFYCTLHTLTDFVETHFYCTLETLYNLSKARGKLDEQMALDLSIHVS